MGADRPRIASELSISERNVENHVPKILKKLDFSSGARIVARVAQRNRPLGGGLGIPAPSAFGA
jgi:DNA-binding NarL/FixJ family response regulator